MSSELPPACLCRTCGYDLTGLQPNTKGHVRCPECGHTSTTYFNRHPMGKAQFHRVLLVQVLLPTTLPILIVFLVSVSYNPMLGLACIVFPTMPIVAFFVFTNAFRNLSEAFDDPPRPIPNWMLAPWILIYLTPGVICYALLMYAAPW